MSQQKLLELIPYYHNKYADNNFPYILLNTKQEIVDCNVAFLRLTGFARNDVINSTFAKLGINYVTANGKLESEQITQYRKRMMVLISAQDLSIVTTATHQEVTLDNQHILGYVCQLNIPSGNRRSTVQASTADNPDVVLRHELKNATANLNVLLYLLEKFITPEGERYHKRLETQIKRIEDLLKSSDEAPSTVVLNNVLKDIIATHVDKANAKNVDIVYINGVEDATIKASYYQLYTVFSNLIGNAIKYTQVGEVIMIVSPHEDTDSIQVEVRDTGIGIPPEDQELIFEDLFRSKNAIEYGYEGQGLGLSIVRNIITELEGDISIQSYVGYGTTITVTL